MEGSQWGRAGTGDTLCSRDGGQGLPLLCLLSSLTGL